jgi:TRAP-type transport system periplasmic protein
MSSVSRRAFVTGGIAAAAVLSPLGRYVHAAEFTIKLGNDLPATHPMNVRLQEVLPKILEDSHGKLEVRIFPNNQLGGDTDMLSQVRSGALEMVSMSGNILSTLSKVMALYGVAFAFPDYAHVWSALDGDLGAYLRAEVKKLGLHALDKVWDNGFRQITTSTKAINGPEDLKGFKIRVPVSPMWTSLFTSLGASPTGINFSEAYSALQTHIVDGQENALPLIEIAKLYEVQKFCTITNHMWDGFFYLVNGQVWGKLPPDLQEVLSRHMNAACLKERDDLLKLSQTVEEKLKGHGMVFNRADPAKFRAVLSKAGYYKKWKDTYGADAWSLLEKYSGPLA